MRTMLTASPDCRLLCCQANGLIGLQLILWGRCLALFNSILDDLLLIICINGVQLIDDGIEMSSSLTAELLTTGGRRFDCSELPCLGGPLRSPYLIFMACFFCGLEYTVSET
jgi:hypothetical protein